MAEPRSSQFSEGVADFRYNAKAVSESSPFAPTTDETWDFIVIGSGFGGSVSALRLVEKGYRVLLCEKGRAYTAQDFPTTNWQLSKWLWLPLLRWRGFFQICKLHSGELTWC